MAEERKRLERIEDRLRGDLSYWYSEVRRLRNEFDNAVKSGNKYDSPWFAQFLPALERVDREMNLALTDLAVINQDLTAAKSDAEYREVLVRAWPANHFLDRMTYLGAAVLGAGGAAYVLVGRDVSVLFWAVGGVLMALGLVGMRGWELRRWEFYADQFSVEAKYRPDAGRWWRKRP